MASVDWEKGFFSTTRGRILLLLRRSRRTVKELAEALDLAENAVRSHLTTMQHYGLIEQHVRRTPGAGKPAYEYRLTTQAESMFPVAQGTILDALLSDMEVELNPVDYQEKLRAVGRRMASRHFISPGNLRTRLEEVVSVLVSMGGAMELEEKDGKFLICGYSCPLGTTPSAHPQICKVMEEMLTSVLGVPVREECQRGDLLSCQLEVTKT